MNDKVDLSLDLTDADGGHPAHHAGREELVGGVRLDGGGLQGVDLQHLGSYSVLHLNLLSGIRLSGV